MSDYGDIGDTDIGDSFSFRMLVTVLNIAVRSAEF